VIKGKKLLASVALAGLVALAASPIALAYYSPTGSTSASSSGMFSWSEPDASIYWYSTSEGSTSWYTALEHSEGQNYYQIAPFEQDEFLYNGTDLYADGIWPEASWYSVIKWPNGSVYISNYYVSGPACWVPFVSSTTLAWPYCSPSGFSMSTLTYPPGSTESHYLIWASGVSGSFGGVYSGSLW
jgi:hypothetical protein